MEINIAPLFILVIICHDVHGFLDFLFGPKVYNEEAAIEEMLEGTGGTLLVDVGLDDQLIVISGKQYTCPSLTIDKGVVECPKGYEKFTVKTKKDYCFAQRYSLLNQNGVKRYCFPSDGYATAFNVESPYKIDCVSYKSGAPNLFVTEEEYNKLCDREPTAAIRYHFYVKDRNKMPVIANQKIVTCELYKCSFPGTLMVDRAYTFTPNPDKANQTLTESGDPNNQPANMEPYDVTKVDKDPSPGSPPYAGGSTFNFTSANNTYSTDKPSGYGNNSTTDKYSTSSISPNPYDPTNNNITSNNSNTTQYKPGPYFPTNYNPGSNNLGGYNPGGNNLGTYSPGGNNLSTYNPGGNNRGTYSPGGNNLSTYNSGSNNLGSYKPSSYDPKNYVSNPYNSGTYGNNYNPISNYQRNNNTVG